MLRFANVGLDLFIVLGNSRLLLSYYNMMPAALDALLPEPFIHYDTMLCLVPISLMLSHPNEDALYTSSTRRNLITINFIAIAVFFFIALDSFTRFKFIPHVFKNRLPEAKIQFLLITIANNLIKRLPYDLYYLFDIQQETHNGIFQQTRPRETPTAWNRFFPIHLITNRVSASLQPRLAELRRRLNQRTPLPESTARTS